MAPYTKLENRKLLVMIHKLYSVLITYFLHFKYKVLELIIYIDNKFRQISILGHLFKRMYLFL